MSTHVTVSPNEAADRFAIRDLVEAHAHCADRREANGQIAFCGGHATWNEPPSEWVTF